MKLLKSRMGAAFAALYAAAFVVAYVYYRYHIGAWLPPPDLALVALAQPLVLTIRALGGAYPLSGQDTFKLIAAAAFCCGLAWIIGGALELIARTIFRLFRRAASP